MKNLLRSNERRRLKIAEILFEKDDWMTFSEISELLGSSVRMLKYDLDTFKNYFDDFTIETSNRGVRLEFHRNKSLKTLYANVLEQSTSFNLLETIFYHEEYSTYELADLLYVSPSTLYRMINHINEVTAKYDFQVVTNPCRLIGNEDNIRSFYYKYFYEKYTILSWTIRSEEEIIDNFLHFFTLRTNIQMDFATYNMFKMMAIVNYIRFKHKHYVKINSTKINLHEVLPNLDDLTESFQYFSKTLNIRIDNHFINQIFKPFLEDGFSASYERLIEKTKIHNKTAESVTYLSEMLDRLAADFNLKIPNKEQVIFGIFNSGHLEQYDPRMGCVLYNRNQSFVDDIKREFPAFHQQLLNELKMYRNFISLPNSEEGLNYLFYITYSYWKGLTLSLRKKHKKIKVLILSNRHTSHSYMLKDFIDYEFSDHLDTQIYDDLYLSNTILEKLDFDLIVANFSLPELQTKRCICIENIPTFQDISKIQAEINRIVLRQVSRN